jgi:hypothetical protein
MIFAEEKVKQLFIQCHKIARAYFSCVSSFQRRLRYVFLLQSKFYNVLRVDVNHAMCKILDEKSCIKILMFSWVSRQATSWQQNIFAWSLVCILLFVHSAVIFSSLVTFSNLTISKKRSKIFWFSNSTSILDRYLWHAFSYCLYTVLRRWSRLRSKLYMTLSTISSLFSVWSMTTRVFATRLRCSFKTSSLFERRRSIATKC